MKSKARQKRGTELSVITVQLLPPGAECLLSYKEIAQALGISERTMRSMVATGEYPSPECFVANKAKWSVPCHNAWIKQRIKEKGTCARSVPTQG